MSERDWASIEGEAAVPTDLVIGNTRVRPGDRVRLRPSARGDIFDLALAGQVATVAGIEQDFEGAIHVAVVVDADPGYDIGRRRPGHRFFFAPHEIEPLAPNDVSETGVVAPTVLVAGIGNIFLGDDGFGVEVVRRLASRSLPPGVRVADYGIRGYDLAYALVSGHDRTILVDAVPRGGKPGTVYLIEPSADALDGDASPATLDAHDMNPLAVLALARSLGARLENITIVGCEPATLGPPEGQLGLSEPVEGAVEQTITLIENMLRDAPPAGDAASRERYVIDPKVSRFTVQAFSGGMLSALGHNPKFVARDFTGEVAFDPDAPDAASMTMTMRSASLTLVDDVSESDRRTIERTMQDEVLESARYPEIVYRCLTAVPRSQVPGQFEVALEGELTLHGVTRPQTILAKMNAAGTTLRAFGEFTLRQSDYDIKPVTVAASMLKVKDELKCTFDIAARR